MGRELRQKDVLIRSFVIIGAGSIGLVLYFLSYPSDLFLLTASLVFLVIGLIFWGLGVLGKLQKKKIESIKRIIGLIIVWICFGFAWLALFIFRIFLGSHAGYIVLVLGAWGDASYYLWLFFNREDLSDRIKEDLNN